MPKTFDKSIADQIDHWNDELSRVTKQLSDSDIRSTEFDNLMREKQAIRIKIHTLKQRITKDAEIRKELFGEVVQIPREYRL